MKNWGFKTRIHLLDQKTPRDFKNCCLLSPDPEFASTVGQSVLYFRGGQSRSHGLTSF